MTSIQADIHRGNVNLTGLDWSCVRTLYCEQRARSDTASDGSLKSKDRRDREYQEPVQAYRQLSVVLQQQGLNEDAARFAYRGQQMQRAVSGRQGKVGQYLFSWILFLLAGYGYKPGQSFLTYRFDYCRICMRLLLSRTGRRTNALPTGSL
jgi:hypothetical protein